MKGLRLYNSAN